MPLDSPRCLRRGCKSHLPKYSSLPELQLVVKKTTLCQCGSTKSLISPTCLSCASTCKQTLAQHEFTSSVPRARRASAPPSVFIKIDLSPWKFTLLAGEHANIDFNPHEAPVFKQTQSKTPSPIISSLSPYMPVHQTFDATAVDLHRDHDDDGIDTDAIRQGDPVTTIPERLNHVATGTRSSSTHTTIERVEYTPEQHNSAMGLKLSQRAFNDGRADKIPAFHCDDTHENLPPIKPAHPKFRPLRRKNHLHVMPCPPVPDASEPIAISLTLHRSSPPTPSHRGKRLTHSHSRAHSHPQSSAASISSGSGLTPPLTPTHQQRSLPPPTSRNPSPESSPVRLGHPTRPYYTAIRKQGISPATPSRSRPQSQPPPSSFHLGSNLTPPSNPTTTNAPRHLSMSAMLPIPPAFSALYDGDDNDDVNDDHGDHEVHSGPTNSARLSLSSGLHRVSYDKHTQTHTRNAQSLSRASKGIINNRLNGVGFSMSGETELRMALAASSPSTTFGRRPATADDGFRFRETVVPSNDNHNNGSHVQANMGSDYLHTRYMGSKDSFMGRVKKLRKGLKGMLMN